VGSLVASVPLGLAPEDDPAVAATVGYLAEHCFVEGAFFQDMIHSGLNAYLTLHVAQCCLRAGEPERALGMVQAVADLASPTGHWPEAVHPRTGGGCMGDGQHGWAAAEWVATLRNLFVREEADRLVLAGGIPPDWLAAGTALRLGPTLTPAGPLHVEIEPQGRDTAVRWRCALRADAMPAVQIALPGHAPQRVDAPDPEGEATVTPLLADRGGETEGAP
jgi:hypothetical protein